jgi:hypothetical protein
MKASNYPLGRERIYHTDGIGRHTKYRQDMILQRKESAMRHPWRILATSLVALLLGWLLSLTAGAVHYVGESAPCRADAATPPGQRPSSQARRYSHQHLPPSEYEPNDKLAASSYRLKKGDTLDEIATLRYGHRYYSNLIARYNHIENQDRVKEGVALKLPDLSDILAKEGFTKVARTETEMILCSRAKYDKVVNQLHEISRGSGARVVPEDIKLTLLESADDLDQAVAGLKANKPGVTRTPKSLIGKLGVNAASMRDMAAGVFDGYGYDIDIVQQNYALALAYAIIWSREGFR